MNSSADTLVQFGRAQLRSGVLIAVVLSGGFKLSAFVREAYIAARFGLSPATDAYYGLQQLPLTVVAFMFGAFSLAFAPAYGRARRGDGALEWLPGLVTHGTALGIVLTAATLALSPVLLGGFVRLADRSTVWTLVLLSLCYVPIIHLGIWAGMLAGTGKAIHAITIAALPYLIMTVVLFPLCEWTGASVLSLPASMAAGFGLMGAVSLVRILSRCKGPVGARQVLWPFGFGEFRSFTKQLAASAAENAGFAANQLAMVYFFNLSGVGAVTANNYAMRIGLLANSIIAQPLAQVAQAKFCTLEPQRLRGAFLRYAAYVLALSLPAAAVLYGLRVEIIRRVYMHGRFTMRDLEAVTALMPAWLVYFVVSSLGYVVARYLFSIKKGGQYAACMLGGYVLSNIGREFACALHASASWIVWCAVIGEGTAWLWALRASWSADPRISTDGPPLAAACAGATGLAAGRHT